MKRFIYILIYILLFISLIGFGQTPAGSKTKPAVRGMIAHDMYRVLDGRASNGDIVSELNYNRNYDKWRIGTINYAILEDTSGAFEINVDTLKVLDNTKLHASKTHEVKIAIRDGTYWSEWANVYVYVAHSDSCIDVDMDTVDNNLSAHYYYWIPRGASQDVDQVVDFDEDTIYIGSTGKGHRGKLVADGAQAYMFEILGNDHYIMLENLDMTGDCAQLIRNENSDYCQFRNCFMHDISLTGSGTIFRLGDTNTEADCPWNTKILDCIFDSTGSEAIYGRSINVEIAFCDIKRTSMATGGTPAGDCIQLNCIADTALVRYNKLDHSNAPANNDKGAFIESHDFDNCGVQDYAYATYEYNYVIGGQADLYGMSTVGEGDTIRYNVIETAYDVGTSTGIKWSNQAPGDNVANNNLIIGFAYGFYVRYISGEIYNNTIHNADTAIEANIQFVGHALDIKNNIFSSISKLNYVGDNTTALTINNNVYDTCIWREEGVTYSSMAAWQVLDHDTNSIDENAGTLLDYFYDMDNDDFHLNPDVPACDNGVDVGLTEDIEGKEYFRGWWIGAYEYNEDQYLIYKNKAKRNQIISF